MRALLREDVRASQQGGMECALRPSRHRPDSRLEGVVSLDQVLEMVAAGSRLRRALTVAEVAEMAAFVAWDRAVA
ncbi:hypothetical protein KBX37_01955 [Micromonospora sp. U56]|uniref:hypothetical protein n=1 Tax=Micromonospora sp. U56 TaxID=2824900 RepID=UPI001B36FA88|nr:hypothetical protein [Micromonospora sp. U56]MBQ0891875.1 hypothetical protein [Micromonospora sp. U56]